MKQKALSTWIALLTAGALAGALPAPAAAQALMHNVQALKGGAAFEGFIVKYREGTLEKADARLVAGAVYSLSTQLRAGNLLQAPEHARSSIAPGLQHARRMALGADVIRSATRLSAAQGLEVMRRLAQLPGVESVEPDLILRPDMVPNDTYYATYQSNLYSGMSGIRVPAAWDLANGAGITIAILDSGITAHNDLQGNLVPGYDFISEPDRARDGNGRDADTSDNGNWQTPGQCSKDSEPRDSSWHGTQVAGVAAAVTNNANGIAGVAYGAKIMPVRVTGACGGTTSDIAEAIHWASGGSVTGVPTLAPGAQAKVINLSIGGEGNCPVAFQDAINAANSRGSTVLVSAGNTNIDASARQFPSCGGVIVVGSVNAQGQRSSFSNFGGVLDLAAPGESIISTSNTGYSTPGTQYYAINDGTSQAVPQVSGTVALMQSRRLALGKPLLAPADLELLLKASARPFPAPCSGCGSGILDAHAAVTAAASGSIKVSEHTDASGKITIAIFTRSASASHPHFHDFAIEVPDDYVVIGGGAEGQNHPGNMLTGSYPKAGLSAWLISSKDHLVYSPTALRGWAIGMKIAGLSRQQLYNNLVVSVAQGGYGTHPNASATLPTGYVLAGGGFKIEWSGAGNLGVSSFPSNSTTWHVQSKDHRVKSPAFARAYVIGISAQIAGVGSIRNLIRSSLSAPAWHPSAKPWLYDGFALTGCGADGRYNPGSPGNLLWRMQPVDDGRIRGCYIDSKDHIDKSWGQIDGYAIGLQAF